MKRRYELVADLLMGAAYADDTLDGCELDTVVRLLEEASGLTPLPSALRARLDKFDVARFGLRKTARALELVAEGEKRSLLELIVCVHESDDVWDLQEDDYVREVADALGVPHEGYADLTIGSIRIADAGATLMPTLPPPAISPPALPKA